MAYHGPNIWSSAIVTAVVISLVSVADTQAGGNMPEP